MQESVTLMHEKGLHARPASMLVQTASSYDASIEILKDGKSANAKSSVAVLSLNADKGDEITIRADGDDDEAAVDALVELVRTDFEIKTEA